MLKRPNRMFRIIRAVALVLSLINLNSCLNIPLQSESGSLKLDNSKNFLNFKINETQIDNREVASGELDDGYQDIETAESRNYVYRPLYVYRRLEHSKRRITMYNSFAG